MLLTDLIAQLQAVAAQKPGILVAINDHEWGLDVPQLIIEKVINEGEYHNLDTISKESYGYALQGVERVYDCEADWKEMDTDTKEYFVSLENYKKEIQKVKERDQKTINDYNSALEILTLTTNTHGVENPNKSVED